MKGPWDWARAGRPERPAFDAELDTQNAAPTLRRSCLKFPERLRPRRRPKRMRFRYLIPLLLASVMDILVTLQHGRVRGVFEDYVRNYEPRPMPQ
jgi:hypothetical protein